jgi:hypothetical protein
VALVLLVLVVVSLLAYLGGKRQTGYLDPAAVDPAGSRALAQVLTGQGVEVMAVRTASEAAAALRRGPGATLLITTPGLVSDRMAAALTGIAVSHTVLVGSVPAAAGPWPEPALASGGGPDSVRDPGCAWAPAVRAGAALTGGTTFEAPAGTSCYDGHVVDLPAGRGAGPAAVTGSVTLLGSGGLLTNRDLAHEGNASLATSVLGRDPVLVWWVPSVADPLSGAGEGGATVTDLLPPWVGWALAQLAVGVLVLAWVRGRRFGPVVIEPLPVTVRAAETTEGLARLYRRAADRRHAGGLLASATTARLSAALRLPRATPTTVVAERVAARTGRSAAAVLALLDHPDPPDDAALVGLATALDALERQVHDS